MLNVELSEFGDALDERPHHVLGNALFAVAFGLAAALMSFPFMLIRSAVMWPRTSAAVACLAIAAGALL